MAAAGDRCDTTVPSQGRFVAWRTWHANSSGESHGENCIALDLGVEYDLLFQTTDWWYVQGPDGTAGYAPPSFFRRAGDGCGPAGGGDGEGSPDRDTDWQNDEYYGEYGMLKVHREMLADVPRTKAYSSALKGAGDWLRGKVVLDVGCGSGILSMLAAKNGARKVYAVEASDFATLTKGIVEDNGLAHIVEVLHSEIEAVTLPEKVDLIVSEWMGTMLVFEYMIESVLAARDAWLKPNGIMWPSDAVLYVVPVTAPTEYHRVVGCWSDQYGFDMSKRLAARAKIEFCGRPKYDYELPTDDVLAKPSPVLQLDMRSATVASLERIEHHFCFTLLKDAPIHGFAAWFDVDFGGEAGGAAPTCLSTAPDQPLTHWKQDLLLFDEPLAGSSGDELSGTFTMTRNAEHRRHLRIRVTCDDGGPDKEWPLWR